MNSKSLTVPSTTNFTRATAARIALASAIVAASLWDFRLATLRIFDLVSLVFICGFFALEFDVKRDWFSKRAYILPLVVLFVAYAIYGYANFDHRSSLAIVLLSLICLQFAGYANASWLARVFRWIVYLNVAAVLLQYFSFRLFGVLLDPNQLLGVTSRIFEGGGGIPYIRAAGLFQEPNSCALNIFMMAAAGLVPRRDRVLTFAAAGTMLITESLWGIVGAFVLVALNEWNSDTALVKKMGIVLALWIAIFVGFNGYLWAVKPARPHQPYLYTRLFHLGSDPSARDRLGALIDKKPQFTCPECKPMAPAIGASKNFFKVFGHGLSTAVFLSAVPDNGYSFFWYCMGPVGLFLLICTFLWSLYGLVLRDMLYIAGAVVFAVTTYPLVTYVIFWLWLPALILLMRQRSENSARAMSGEHAAGEPA